VIQVQGTWPGSFLIRGLTTALTLRIARCATDNVRIEIAHTFPVTRAVEFMAGVAAFLISRTMSGFWEKTTIRSATVLEFAALCAAALSMHLATVYTGREERSACS
jgi:peptidoglycan/LPS O-acetylase OafA/YrhL